MVARYVDSFDTYTTITERWTSTDGGSFDNVIFRTGIQSFRPNNTRLTLNAQGTWIVGGAFYFAAIGARRGVATIDAGTVQGEWRLSAAGRIELYRGGTLLATGTTVLLAATFYYIEFKHIILNAAGTLEVRINGSVEVTFAGDTQETANATAEQIGLLDTSASIRVDDFYIYDGTGAANNNYAGDSQIEAELPDGAGAATAWTTVVGAGTHWQAVNEVPPNGDTSYVESDTADQIDEYTFTNLTPTSATIPTIQVSMRARKTQAGALNIARMYRSGVTDNQGANVALNTSYTTILEIMETDPVAVGAWTVANLNAAQFGARSRA